MKEITLLTFLFLLFFSASVFAQEAPESNEYTAEEAAGEEEIAPEDIFVMEDMEVVESVQDNTGMGKTEVPKDILENMPAGDGNVTDILRVLPSVQYDND
ncbi:MAG: hypothetical protein LBD73_04990 [Deferribacteraceae bacterium]|jgi:hypothetical protein|nr:hypothetical protein [Deferribacteraceae bacterium]